MFPLSRPHRQFLATLLLLILTVLPTGFVAVTAWRIHHEGYARVVEFEIGRQLGLQASIESVRYPRPGEVVYEGIVLRQEEPRHRGYNEIARARTLRVRRADRDLIAETVGLRVRGESPDLALTQVGALLQRPIPATLERISLSAPTCALDLGREGASYDLSEVAGTFQADARGPSARVSYRLPSPGSSTRCELSLTRDRAAEPVRTTLVLKTMEGLPLPARVLDLFFDTRQWLGQAARVEGTLTLRQSSGKGWEADFQGDLHDVDLATLVSKRFPSHRLSGLARIALDSARWGERPGQGYGWVESRGALTTGQGSMGIGLLRALESEMSFRISRDAVARLQHEQGQAADVDFRALGLTFAMTPDGEIRLEGGLGSEFAPGVVVANPSRPIAYAPLGAANVRGLIKALFPAGASDPRQLIPLSAESRLLLCLPVPSQLERKPIGGN